MAMMRLRPPGEEIMSRQYLEQQQPPPQVPPPQERMMMEQAPEQGFWNQDRLSKLSSGMMGLGLGLLSENRNTENFGNALGRGFGLARGFMREADEDAKQRRWQQYLEEMAVSDSTDPEMRNVYKNLATGAFDSQEGMGILMGRSESDRNRRLDLAESTGSRQARMDHERNLQNERLDAQQRMQNERLAGQGGGKSLDQLQAEAAAKAIGSRGVNQPDADMLNHIIALELRQGDRFKKAVLAIAEDQGVDPNALVSTLRTEDGKFALPQYLVDYREQLLRRGAKARMEGAIYDRVRQGFQNPGPNPPPSSGATRGY